MLKSVHHINLNANTFGTHTSFALIDLRLFKSAIMPKIHDSTERICLTVSWRIIRRSVSPFVYYLSNDSCWYSMSLLLMLTFDPCNVPSSSIGEIPRAWHHCGRVSNNLRVEKKFGNAREFDVSMSWFSKGHLGSAKTRLICRLALEKLH